MPVNITFCQGWLNPVPALLPGLHSKMQAASTGEVRRPNWIIHIEQFISAIPSRERVKSAHNWEYPSYPHATICTSIPWPGLYVYKIRQFFGA
jgi:hypothetical protein